MLIVSSVEKGSDLSSWTSSSVVLMVQHLQAAAPIQIGYLVFALCVSS